MLAAPLQAPTLSYLPHMNPPTYAAPSAVAPAPASVSAKNSKSPRVARQAPDGGLICDWDGCMTVHGDPDALYQHLCNQHIGRKATGNLCLTCKWPGCDIVCAKRDHITSHLRVHTPLKPHTCEVCSKAFKRPQDLKKHEKIHTEEHHSAHRHSRAVTVPSSARNGSRTTPPPSGAPSAPESHPPSIGGSSAFNFHFASANHYAQQQMTMASILAQQEQLNQQAAAVLGGYSIGPVTNHYAAAASQNAAALAAHVARSSQQHSAIAAAAAAAAQAHRPYPAGYGGFDATRAPPAVNVLGPAPSSLYPSIPTFLEDVSSPESYQSAAPSPLSSDASQHRRSPSLSAARSPAYLAPHDAILDPRGAGSSPGGTKRTLDDVADIVIHDVKRGRYASNNFNQQLDSLADLLPADFNLPAMTRDDGMSSSSSSGGSPAAELRGLNSTLASPQEPMSKADVDVLNDFLLQIGQDLEGHGEPAFAPQPSSTTLYPSLESYMHNDPHDALFAPYATSARHTLPPPSIAPDYSREPTFHHIDLLQRAPPSSLTERIELAPVRETKLAPIDRPDAVEGRTTLPSLREMIDVTPMSPASLANEVDDLAISSPPLTGVRRSHAQQRDGETVDSPSASSSAAETVMVSSGDEGDESDVEHAGERGFGRAPHKRSRTDTSGLSGLADLAEAAEQAVRERRLKAVQYLVLRANAQYRASLKKN